MNSLGKYLQSELDLSDDQANKVDELFKEFNREHIWPTFQPFSERLLIFKYLKKGAAIFTKEQLKKYRQIRRQAKLENEKPKITKNIHRERIVKEYKSLNLSDAEINKIDQITKEHSYGKNHLEIRQKKIKRIIESNLNSDQIHALNIIFTSQIKQHKSRKIKNVKRQYRLLQLNDDQAKRVIQFERSELDKQKYNNNDLEEWESKDELFKEILSSSQYESYLLGIQNIKDKKETKIKNKKVRNEIQTKNSLLELEEKEEFILKEMLDQKCNILKQVLASASALDHKSISSLQSQFEAHIDKNIENIRLKNSPPLSKKLMINRVAQSFILPISISLHKEIDLNKNMFEDLSLSISQKEELEAIEYKLRTHILETLEKKVKHPGGVFSSIGRQTFKYYRLYSLVLLDPDPQVNIEKMRKRKID